MKENKIFNILFGILIVFLALVPVFTNLVILKEGKQIGEHANFRDVISVTGQGELFVEPDMATAIFTVVTESKDVDKALKDNSDNSSRVADFLLTKGVDEKDVKSINFNIGPRYEYNDALNKRVLVGYQVIHSLEVKIREIGETGAIVEGAVAIGVNEVSDIRFIVEEEEEYYNKARSMAIIDAKKNAKKLASELGVELGGIVSYQEGGMPIVFRSPMAKEESVSADSFQVGENLIKATVNIEYEIGS